MAQRFVRIFVAPSRNEYLRQHRERLIGADHQYEAEANVLSVLPQTAHVIAADAALSSRRYHGEAR